MAHRLLAALFVVGLGAGSAFAQSESGNARTREAAAALVRGNVDQAITLYTEALEDKSLSNDRRATILNDRGVAYARRQQNKEAIEDFNRAIQLYPEYAAIYNNRGNVLLGLGAVREALKDFDRALVLAPGYAAAYSNRAGAYMRIGQLDRRLFFGDIARRLQRQHAQQIVGFEIDRGRARCRIPVARSLDAGSRGSGAHGRERVEGRRAGA